MLCETWRRLRNQQSHFWGKFGKCMNATTHFQPSYRNLSWSLAHETRVDLARDDARVYWIRRDAPRGIKLRESSRTHASHNLLIGSFNRNSRNREQNAWQERASKLSFRYFTRHWKRRKCSSAHWSFIFPRYKVTSIIRDLYDLWIY